VKFSGIIVFAIAVHCAVASANPQEPLASPPAVSQEAPSEREVLLRTLRAGQFEQLDAYVGRLQAAYETDSNQESAIAATLRAFAVADPELSSRFDQWRTAKPKSYAAHAAAGAHFGALAWAWRGNRTIDKTPPVRIEQMNRYLDLAHRAYSDSLPLASKPTFSLAGLIRIYQTLGLRAEADNALAEAERRDPQANAAREAYILLLQPRWGGSHAEMDAFAKTVGDTATSDKQRRLANRLAARSLGDRAYQAWENNDRTAALRLLDEAAARSGDPGIHGYTRARILHQVGQTASAQALYDRILAHNPDDTEALYARGYLLLQSKQVAAGMRDIYRAAEGRDVVAMSKLGLLLVEGDHGVGINIPEGMRWLERAAYFRNPEAAFLLGKSYERGLGIPVDQPRAVGYYRIAVEGDHGPSQNDLGLMLWYGRGTKQDQEEAVRLWKLAAAKDIWQAKHNLEYFLTPTQRAGVAIANPQLKISVGSREQYAGAAAVVVLLGALVWVRRRRSRRGPSQTAAVLAMQTKN